jgi:hypothetical protein
MSIFVSRMLAQDTEGHVVDAASSAGLASSSGQRMYKVSRQVPMPPTNAAVPTKIKNCDFPVTLNLLIEIGLKTHQLILF